MQEQRTARSSRSRGMEARRQGGARAAQHAPVSPGARISLSSRPDTYSAREMATILL